MQVKLGEKVFEAKQVRLEYGRNPEDLTRNLLMFYVYFDEAKTDFEELVATVSDKTNLVNITYIDNQAENILREYQDVLKCTKTINSSNTEIELTLTKAQA